MGADMWRWRDILSRESMHPLDLTSEEHVLRGLQSGQRTCCRVSVEKGERGAEGGVLEVSGLITWATTLFHTEKTMSRWVNLELNGLAAV